MNFTLNILGTASALPTASRYPSAQVLEVRGRLFMLDCGEAAQMQLRRAGISILKIDNICLSHMHGDHVFGIFGLLSTMAMLGRTAPLHIYAPRAFATTLQFFMANFAEGFKYEVKHHVLNMKKPEMVFDCRTCEIIAFPLNHRIDTYGFLIREKEPILNIDKKAIEKYGLGIAEIAALKRGENVSKLWAEKSYLEPVMTEIRAEDVTYKPYEPRSYAYCSDTAPFPELAEWIKGVDLLYHETTFPQDMGQMAGATYHSTTVQAAECAAKAGVGKLLVGHYSSRYPDVRFFLDEIRAVFPNAALAREGDVIEISHSLRKG